MKQNTTSQRCWTPVWLQAVTGGRWLKPPANPDLPLSGLSIDSRSIKPGQVFLAVKGEQFDGHDFITHATQSGAAVAVIERVDEAEENTSAGLLLVDKTVTALHQLARSYRDVLRKSGCRVIAVVGSNGKTTTRHLIHAVLSSKFKGTQSPKSFNNHLGVPLTLLGASTDDQYLVAEVGTNHPGEIDALGELLKPDAAVITCIGNEHMEFFGDLQGVAEEETAITQHLPPHADLFIETDAYPWVQKTSTFNPDSNVIVYGLGSSGAEEQGRVLGARQRFAFSATQTIDLPLIAPHDINNALAAIEVGRSMGVADSQIKSALEKIRPMPGRLEVKHFGPVTVIDDTYNANPDSTLAALNVLAEYPKDPPGQRVVVLADMLELGGLAEEAHREVGKTLSKMSGAGSIQHITLIGPRMAWAAEELAGNHPKDGLTHYLKIDADTPANITEPIRPNDVVLFKGSRGMQLEILLPALRGLFTE